MGDFDSVSLDSLPGYEDVADVRINVPDITLKIATLTGVWDLDVAFCDTISDVKRRIAELKSTAEESLVLSLDGEVLKNDQTVASYSLKENSCLKLSVRSQEAADGVTSAHSGTNLLSSQYDDVNDDTVNNDDDDEDDDEELPEYETLMERLNEARRREHGAQLVRSIMIILVQSGMCLCCMGIALVLPIVMVVIGYRNRNDCTPNSRIPVWLLVMGVANILLYGQALSSGSRRRRQPNAEDDRGDSFQSLVQFFIFAWFIIGSVWVFGCDDCIDRGCDSDTYNLAFGVLVTVHSILALIILAFFCGVCCTMQRRQPGAEAEPNPAFAETDSEA